MRRVDAVILAAGGSRRFGQPKQFLPWRGESLIRRAVRAAAEGGCARVIVVAGDASEQMAAELSQAPAELVWNPDWERGLGTSIRSGLEHLLRSNDQREAVALLACDQPFVDAPVISKLIACWQNSGKAIVASRYAGTRGIPALFTRARFDALLALPDDSGAKGLLVGESDVAEVAFEEGALDVDRPVDFARAQATLAHRDRLAP